MPSGRRARSGRRASELLRRIRMHLTAGCRCGAYLDHSHARPSTGRPKLVHRAAGAAGHERAWCAKTGGRLMVQYSSQAARAEEALLKRLRARLQPLQGSPHDFDQLLQLIGPARFALLGEASHGTAEFYRERARITQRLITEKGFTAVAVEADWPDAWRVNRYVRGLSDDPDATAALAGFQRFPGWMWRNMEVRDFVEWRREFNTGRERDSQVGFYGIDLYSLFSSIQAVVAYLDRTDP